MSEWKNIDSAPKDGTPIDLWHTEYGRLTDVWWDEKDGFWVTGAPDQQLITHWLHVGSPGSEGSSLDWRPIDENTPRHVDTEIMLYYREWCGEKDMVVSGHWDSEEPFEEERTWVHSYGYGDADMWAPIPLPPKPEVKE